MVPAVGIEPTRPQGTRDFESIQILRLFPIKIKYLNFGGLRLPFWLLLACFGNCPALMVTFWLHLRRKVHSTLVFSFTFLCWSSCSTASSGYTRARRQDLCGLWCFPHPACLPLCFTWCFSKKAGRNSGRRSLSSFWSPRYSSRRG